ncbi:MAG: hypothetical protein GYB68_03820, partial [Chloroflexi bacterium]|nr:hypothetical protein [Chloroflexota bacterium]
MDDERNPDDSLVPSFDDDPEEQAQEENERPPNRLDRLIKTRKRAEREAEEWSNIERQGGPVPSQDKGPTGLTQPIPPLPDRPTTQKAEDPVQAQGRGEPESPIEPQQKTPSKRRGGRRPAGPPPFPHPTDPVPPPAPPEPIQLDSDEPSTPEPAQTPPYDQDDAPDLYKV